MPTTRPATIDSTNKPQSSVTAEAVVNCGVTPEETLMFGVTVPL